MGIFGLGSEGGSQISTTDIILELKTSDVILESNKAISGQKAASGNELEMAIKPLNMDVFGLGSESGSQILTGCNVGF